MGTELGRLGDLAILRNVCLNRDRHKASEHLSMQIQVWMEIILSSLTWLVIIKRDGMGK